MEEFDDGKRKVIREGVLEEVETHCVIHMLANILTHRQIHAQ